MMLDVNTAQLRAGTLKYLPIGALVGLILLAELVLGFASWAVVPELFTMQPTPPITEVTNTAALGRVLYTDYIYLFQASGLVLLVAMIGAIVLTHRQREGVRKQVIARQLARRREEAVAVVKVTIGSGV
jgi:NADH-quinone oxidoreductase subunit J